MHLHVNLDSPPSIFGHLHTLHWLCQHKSTLAPRARTFFFFFLFLQPLSLPASAVKSCVAVIVVFLNMKGLSTMNALALAGMAIRTRAFVVDSQDIEFGNPWWFVYAGISCFLVLFAGIMSGLTLGLMSLGLVELEILQRSGTSTEKKQAGLFIYF